MDCTVAEPDGAVTSSLEGFPPFGIESTAGSHSARSVTAGTAHRTGNKDQEGPFVFGLFFSSISRSIPLPCRPASSGIEEFRRTSRFGSPARSLHCSSGNQIAPVWTLPCIMNLPNKDSTVPTQSRLTASRQCGDHRPRGAGSDPGETSLEVSNCHGMLDLFDNPNRLRSLIIHSVVIMNESS